MLTLRERDFEAFFEAPYRAYGEESFYASPLKSDLRRFLDPQKNPLFRGGDNFTYYTVHNGDGPPVGRIVVHIHRESNARHGWKRAFFGFFDVANSVDVARMLLDAAEKWARAQGMAELIGNFNFTAMQMAGVITEGHENEPFADTAWNPPHTPKLLEACGYKPSFPMTVMSSRIHETDPNAFRECTLETSRLDWGHFRKSHFNEDLDTARKLLNAGFSHNPMFVPQTWEEIYFQAKDMSYVLDEEISTIVRVDGQAAGVAIIIPDIYKLLRGTRSQFSWRLPWEYLKFRLTNNRAVAIFISVDPQFHNCGLMSGLLRRSVTLMQKRGYRRLGMTWIADENIASLKTVAKLGGKPIHRLFLFGKELA